MSVFLTFLRQVIRKNIKCTRYKNRQETQLSLTNRATRLAILTFEKYRDLETGVKGH